MTVYFKRVCIKQEVNCISTSLKACRLRGLLNYYNNNEADWVKELPPAVNHVNYLAAGRSICICALCIPSGVRETIEQLQEII